METTLLVIQELIHGSPAEVHHFRFHSEDGLRQISLPEWERNMIFVHELKQSEDQLTCFGSKIL